MRRVFVLNHDEAMLYAYADYLKANGYEVFATTNDYKFILYAKEIAADVFVIDTKNPADFSFFERLKTARKNGYTPILLLTDYHKNFIPHETITHILFKPFRIENFADIIESYCIRKKAPENIVINLQEESERLPTENLFYVENRQKHQDTSALLD